ncbi:MULTISPECIES: DUF6350 family protein [unclassified Nocardioides]|uniref:cell division protein PerM n=1 Tax=unclassified Nocardioides TaxID=2615069 RepID=UPI0006F907F0|nr:MULTISPECIES: DUF6350 family protein [unclassified Nocardioides]KQY64896.1 hypothetical protein ASD30_06970 [Nocardioides sp. Root140]KQZ67724.1 hypothetical protein ASD66_20735 [Nocardioides sp. Root151]
MTATLSPPGLSPAETNRRPLTLLATVAGLSAAASTLAVCLGLALLGWFLADGGIHGAPRDALRAGGLGWLMGHGSGVTVQGVAITAVPLGLTLLFGVVVWRFGLRLGEQVAGHGPDADALSDGDRDWTVPAATGLFAATYVVVAVFTAVLCGTGDLSPDLNAVMLWSLALTCGVGGTGIAIGSGRASIWLSLAPPAVRASLHAAWSVVLAFLVAAAGVFVVALALDFGAAMNVMSQLHLDTGDGLMFVVLVLTVVPNAVIFSGAYLLGPGFLVGTGTLVSPSLVAIGPVPMFPLLAALPDTGPTPAWTPALIVLPVLCAAAGVVRSHRHSPTAAWDEGALRGVVGGVLAGLLFGLLAAVAGGAVGPGRMTDVGPLVSEVLWHGIVSLGAGGLLGGLLATWWTRRSLPEEAPTVDS